MAPTFRADGLWPAIPLLCLLNAAAHADEAQDRARALYEGRPTVPAITARVGAGTFDVPAGRFPCRNCHARDGRGGREAGTAAPPIHPSALSRPTLERPPYDPALFARAVRNGRGSGGRVLDTSMPRYALDEAGASALWAFLAVREAEETAGVDAGSVRFGVAAGTGLDLPALMRAAWRERGEPVIHGRRVRFEPAGGEAVLAILFDREAPSSAAPRLFPFASWSDGDRSDEVRALFADRSRQAAALAERLPPGARRIAEREPTGGSGDRSVQEDLADVRAIDGPALVLAGPGGWAKLVPRIGRGAHLFAPLHDVEPFLARLLGNGATVSVADPSSRNSASASDPFPVRLVRTAAAVLEDALVQAGRDLTRGGLMRAVGTVRREDLPWPDLDYARHPVSGSQAVRITTMKPAP